MTWIRSNIQFVTRIALFALAMQFALSFSHFHAIASGSTPAPTFGSALSKLSFGSFSSEVADSQSAQQPAPNHDSGEHPGDICAICAVIAMANAALFVTPPALPLPQIIDLSPLTTKREFVRVAPASVAYQSRAPPTS
jgi:hypothetical protein